MTELIIFMLRLTISLLYKERIRCTPCFHWPLPIKAITSKARLHEQKLNRSVFWMNMPVPIRLHLSGIQVHYFAFPSVSVFLSRDASRVLQSSSWISLEGQLPAHLIFKPIVYFPKCKWSSQVEGSLAYQAHFFFLSLYQSVNAVHANSVGPLE